MSDTGIHFIKTWCNKCKKYTWHNSAGCSICWKNENEYETKNIDPKTVDLVNDNFWDLIEDGEE